MPRWVYTHPWRTDRRSLVPGHRAPSRFVVVRRIRPVSIGRVRRASVPLGRAARESFSLVAVLVQRRLVLVRRSMARQVVPGRPEARQSEWVRVLRRMRERLRRFVQRPRPALPSAPPTFVRGTGYPKGANAYAGSVIGDNAFPGSRKGANRG